MSVGFPEPGWFYLSNGTWSRAKGFGLLSSRPEKNPRLFLPAKPTNHPKIHFETSIVCPQEGSDRLIFTLKWVVERKLSFGHFEIWMSVSARKSCIAPAVVKMTEVIKLRMNFPSTDCDGDGEAAASSGRWEEENERPGAVDVFLFCSWTDGRFLRAAESSQLHTSARENEDTRRLWRTGNTKGAFGEESSFLQTLIKNLLDLFLLFIFVGLSDWVVHRLTELFYLPNLSILYYRPDLIL